MRRISHTFVLIVLLITATGVAVAAQDATPAAGEHPLVGTWLLDTDADDPANAPEVVIFTADGGYISVDAEAFPTLGVWEPTGETTANLTLTSTGVNEDGSYFGTFVVRASVEVDATGEAFTAQYSAEIVDPDGVGSGEFGPGTATATRLVAEPMGEPQGPLSVLFGEGATPAAATPEG